MKKENKKLKLTPMGDRVLIKGMPKEDKKTAGGIIIPDTVKDDRGAKQGIVVAVGKGKYENGKLLPVALSIGDKVLYGWGDDVVLDGEDYILVRESEIIGIMK